MGFNRVVSYLLGYVEILIRGAQPEKIINLATNSGLYLWDVRRVASEVIHAKMRAHGFLRIREMSKRSGCRIKIHRKHGWPFFRKRLTQRAMFIIGASLFLGLMVYISSFILFVKVEGLGGKEETKLLLALERAGLKRGITRKELLERKRVIEREVMLVNPGTVWLGIAVKGVVAEVKAVPRKTAPVPAGPSNIVATDDGVVTKIVAIRGIPAVKEGDTVAHGDLLISGIRWYRDPETGEIVKEDIPAGGVVEARVWYDIEVLEPKIVWEPIFKKNRWVRYRLRCGERIWDLARFGKEPTGNYFWERRFKRIYQGRNRIKVVEFIKDTCREVVWRKVSRPLQVIKRAALAEAALKRKQLKNLTVQHQSISWTDEGLFVKLITTLETTKEISMVVPR